MLVGQPGCLPADPLQTANKKCQTGGPQISQAKPGVLAHWEGFISRRLTLTPGPSIPMAEKAKGGRQWTYTAEAGSWWSPHKAPGRFWMITFPRVPNQSSPGNSKRVTRQLTTIYDSLLVSRMTYLLRIRNAGEFWMSHLWGWGFGSQDSQDFTGFTKPGVTKCVHFNISAIENATGRPIWRPSICSRTKILSLFLLLTTTTIILFWKQTVLVHLPIPFCQETMVSGRSTETVNLIKCSRMTMGKWVESRLLLLFAFNFLCCFVLWAQHLENYDELQS